MSDEDPWDDRFYEHPPDPPEEDDRRIDGGLFDWIDADE